MSEFKDYFSTSMAAEYVGVSRYTIHTLAARGVLPCTHDARGWRWFRREDLDAYIEARGKAGLTSHRARRVDRPCMMTKRGAHE